MKINDVLNENQLNELGTLRAIGGALAGLKGGIAGAKGGWAAGKGAAQEKDLVKRTVQKAMNSWGQQQQRLKMAGQPVTPETAAQWFAQFSRQPAASAPRSINPGDITSWLNQEVAKYLTAKNSAQPAAPAQPEQPQAQPTQPQAQPAPKPVETGAKTKAGTEVIKPEPLTLKYKNQNYVRGGEKGKWTRFGSTKPLPPTEQAFLDSEEDELAGTPQTQPATQQQPTTAEPAQPAPPPGGFKATVVDDNGQYVYKRADDNWYREDGTKVQAYDQIEDLEQKFADAKAAARTRGTEPSATAAPAGAQELPDVSALTPEERTQLIQQIKQQLGKQA